MAAYTASVDGFWDVAATWGGSGPPGAGDTATIGNAVQVTVRTNVTVGHSPATDDGTPAILIADINWDEELIIQDNCTLTVRGDLACRGTLTLEAGSTLVMDPAEAADPENTTYKLKIGTADGDFRAKLVCEGAVGNRCTIKTNKVDGGDGIGANAVATSPTNNSGRGEITHTDFIDFGGAGETAYCLYFKQDNDSFAAFLTSCTFTRCGIVRYRGTQAVDAYTMAIDDNVWTDSLNTSFTGLTGPVCLQASWVSTQTGGTRSVSGNRFDLCPYFVDQKGVVCDDNIGRMLLLTSTASKFGNHENNFWWRDFESDGMLVAGEVIDTYLYEAAVAVGAGGPRCMSSGPTVTSNTIDGCIIESASTGTSGDLIFITGTNNAIKTLVQNCIVLPSAVDGNSPGKLISAGGESGTRCEVYHNTIVSTGTGENGISVGETYAGEAGMIPAVKSNIFWTPAGKTAGIKALRGNAAGDGVVDIITPAGWLNNWGSGLAAGSETNGFEDLEPGSLFF
jgi:hypothetical protein